MLCTVIKSIIQGQKKMKIYTKLGNNPDCHYTQVNNPTEEIIRKDDIEDREKLDKIMIELGFSKVIRDRILASMGGYLETCGPSALSTGVHAIGQMPKIIMPGGYKPQVEQLIEDCMNDPNSYNEMIKYRSDVNPVNWMGNRIPQWYQYASKAVFGVGSLFIESKDPDYIRQSIDNNMSVMACMINPGHFIPIVGYDNDSGNFIYHDPWPGNYYPNRLVGTSAFNRELTPQEWKANIYGWTIRIGG